MIIEKLINVVGGETQWKYFLLSNPDLIEHGFIPIPSEFFIDSPFEDGRGRIDIVGLDKNSVVCLIEIKLYPERTDMKQLLNYYNNLMDSLSFFVKDISNSKKKIRLILFGISLRHITISHQEIVTKTGNEKIEIKTFSDNELLIERLRGAISLSEPVIREMKINREYRKRFCSDCRYKDKPENFCSKCLDFYKQETVRLRKELLDDLKFIEW